MAATHLVMEIAGRRAALPLAAVIETCRPLGVRPVPRSPAWLQGVAVLRGESTPVVSLSELLGWTGPVTPGGTGRWVAVRVGSQGRTAALAVDSVQGLHDLPESVVSELPPLAEDAGGAGVSALVQLDGELGLVLDAARLIPDDAWVALVSPAGEAPAT